MVPTVIGVVWYILAGTAYTSDWGDGAVCGAAEYPRDAAVLVDVFCDVVWAIVRVAGFGSGSDDVVVVMSVVASVIDAFAAADVDVSYSSVVFVGWVVPVVCMVFIASILYAGEPIVPGHITGLGGWVDWSGTVCCVVGDSGVTTASKGFGIAAVVFDGLVATDAYGGFESGIVGSGDASMGTAVGASVGNVY